MKRPQSCTVFWINIVGLASFLCTLFVVLYFDFSLTSADKIIALAISICLPIVGLEFFFKRPALLASTVKFNSNFKRTLIKLLSLYCIWSVIGFIYWVFPEYHGSFYLPYWAMLLPVIPWLFVLSVPYIWFVDARMEQPEDAYYHFGMWLLSKQNAKAKVISQLFLGWLVKLFFLPLMVVYLTNNITTLSNKYTWQNVVVEQIYTFDFFWIMYFTIDLAFVSVGYVMTLRLFDSHIRSTEPTVVGWVSALICYQPFMGTLSGLYFAYNLDNVNWWQWLSQYPVVQAIWGSLIMACLFIYTLSSVMFGIRFSNLTHRGIITNGPYRFSKHPAYLSKNLSWWLVSVPFVSLSNDYLEVIRACSMLALMNGVYYLRAKTEERHLIHDDVYKDYAKWINKNGLLAKLKLF